MPPGDQHSFPVDVQLYNGSFVNKRNQKIHCYYWNVSDGPRALLMISHGFTEHSMVYDSLAGEMAKKGFFVFSHDHIGHGHSDGTRAYMDDIQDLVEDSMMHIKLVRERYPDLPLFMCGHSLGGTITLKTILEKEFIISGAVLIAPALAPNPETASPFKVTLSKVLSKYFPHFPVAFTDFSLSCQNAKNVSEMDSDPLRYHGYWKVRPINCLLQTGEEVLKQSSEIKTPFLLLHGEMDKICHVSGATNFFEDASSEDKTLKIYPTGFHSLLLEPEEIANDVFNQTVQWLDSKVQ